MTIAEELGLIELVKAIKEERDEKNAPTMGDWIKLNVGGSLFETSRQTLTQVPDSLLGRMFDPDSSLPPAKMKDGAFLIDASPGSFAVILHWLRCREVCLGEVTLESALSAANYFGLLELVETLSKKEKPFWNSDWIELTVDGTIFGASRATLTWSGQGRDWTGHGLLARMFDSSRPDYSPPPRDSNGAFRIECRTEIFAAILDMLRYQDFDYCSLVSKGNFYDVNRACSKFVGVTLDKYEFFGGY